jgi:hypothetical protein
MLQRNSLVYFIMFSPCRKNYNKEKKRIHTCKLLKNFVEKYQWRAIQFPCHTPKNQGAKELQIVHRGATNNAHPQENYKNICTLQKRFLNNAQSNVKTYTKTCKV